MIAILLFSCLMLSVSVGILLTYYIGTPVNFNGKIENIRVQITEVCTRNRSIICDSNGKYSDYIELFNAGESFDLSGFALSDNQYKEVKYVFESRFFKSGEYLIVFLNGKDVPFSLKSEGNETVYLLSPEGDVVTSVITVPMDSNKVMSLQDGSYVVTADASPGFPNTAEGMASYRLGLTDGSGTLVISELLTANKSVLPDSKGIYSDIIEITNIASYAVSTSGWYVSDDIGNPHRYPLPDRTLQPGEFLVLFCGGESGNNENEIHVPFGLSEGETVLLSGTDGKYTSAEISACADNVSVCRTLDENGNVIYEQMSPSPGFSNTEDGTAAFSESRIDNSAEVIINEILLSSDGLAFGSSLCDVIELKNCSAEDITLDGWNLTDDSADPYKYPLSGMTIKAGEYAVIIADSQNNCDGKYVHANFSLSQGETLILYTPEFKQCVPFNVISAGRGNSWQYDSSSEGSVYIAGKPSIGFSNDAQGRADYAAAVRPAGIEISEAVSVNTKYLKGPYGVYHDFIEFHNRSDREISLSGLFLSDNSGNLKLAALPEQRIPADGYVIFILSADGLNTPSGYTVLPFALSAEGESVYLSNSGGIIDCITIPPLDGNVSYGRAKDSDSFSYLTEATPLSANAAAAEEKSEKPSPSVAQGVYNNIESLCIELNGNGSIRYTLDCTEPTAVSAIYSGTINITATTVLRARCFTEGHLPSDILDLLYVVNEGNKLEVASLITNPENLWDYYKGIYVKGPNAASEFPYVGANFWQSWEKEATVSFFASDGTSFSESCGIRIFGAFSRADEKKSFTCFFRAQYGASELEYPLFKDSNLNTYEAFVFRTSGQDFNRARMRDALITSLVAEKTTVAVQKYRPVVLYLNGEFWGIYYIREKINENYIAGNYNVTEESVTLTRANGSTSNEYKALIAYVGSHDIAIEENYQYVLTQIDKENYIDYICAEIYIANNDNGNIRFFKSTEMDGKWRWILFDLDWSFLEYQQPTIFEHLNPEGTGAGNAFSTVLINALLKNKGFKEEFLRRMAWQIQNIWTEENVRAHISEIKALIQPDVVLDCEKWGYSYSMWEKQVNKLITFNEKRPAELYAEIKSYFSLSDSKMTELGF